MEWHQHFVSRKRAFVVPTTTGSPCCMCNKTAIRLGHRVSGIGSSLAQTKWVGFVFSGRHEHWII